MKFKRKGKIKLRNDFQNQSFTISSGSSKTKKYRQWAKSCC